MVAYVVRRLAVRFGMAYISSEAAKKAHARSCTGDLQVEMKEYRVRRLVKIDMSENQSKAEALNEGESP